MPTFYNQPTGFRSVTGPSREKQHQQRIADLKESGQKEISQLKQRTSEFNSMVVQANQIQDLKEQNEVKKLQNLSNQFNTFIQDGVVKRLQEEERKADIRRDTEAYTAFMMGDGTAMLDGANERLEEFNRIEEEKAKLNQGVATTLQSQFETQRTRFSLIEQHKMVTLQGLYGNKSALRGATRAFYQKAGENYPAWSARIKAGIKSDENAPDHIVEIDGKPYNVTQNYKNEQDGLTRAKVDAALGWQYYHNNNLIAGNKGGIHQELAIKYLMQPIAKENQRAQQMSLLDQKQAVSNTNKIVYQDQIANAVQGDKPDYTLFASIINRMSLDNYTWQGPQANKDRKADMVQMITEIAADKGRDEVDIETLLSQKVRIGQAGEQTVEAFLGVSKRSFIGKIDEERITTQNRLIKASKADYQVESANNRRETMLAMLNGDRNAQAMHALKQSEIESQNQYFQGLDPSQQKTQRDYYALPVTQKNREQSEQFVKNAFPGATKGGGEIDLDTLLDISNGSLDFNYMKELIKDGTVTQTSFAGLNNVNSAGTKTYNAALPDIEEALTKAYGVWHKDHIAPAQIQKALKRIKPIAIRMAKELQTVRPEFQGDEDGALRQAFGDIVRRIKADNPSQFPEAVNLDGYTAKNYRDLEGGFKVRGDRGIQAFSDENPGPSVPQRFKQLMGFTETVQNSVQENPSFDAIGYKGPDQIVYPGLRSPDDVGFKIHDSDPNSTRPSNFIQQMAKNDPHNRHWTVLHDLQSDKIGKERIDWKKEYPKAYQESLYHYASSDEELNLARQGDNTSLIRLAQRRENNKTLPPEYRVSVMGMVEARDEIIPEIHFTNNLIHGAKLQSRTYEEFLKNNEDQVKASKWLTHRLLVIADQDTDSASERAMRAFVGFQYGEEAMKNFDNKEQIDFARRSWWAYRSGNKSQTDFPGDIRISAVKSQPVSYGFQSLNPITGWRDAGRTLAKMEAQKERVATEKQNQQILNREEAITGIKEALQGNSTIAMPYARMLLGDDIVQGLIRANARNYDALQQALRNELELWMKPI